MARIPSLPSVQRFADTTAIPTPPHLSWPPPPLYNNTVKELGNVTSANVCEKLCVAYVNAAVSPVSGWTRCEAFTWLAHSGRCVAMVDAGEWAPHPAAGATTGRLAWPPAPCGSDRDCSLNGACVARRCVCDAAWRGDRCSTLALLPTRADAGLRAVDGGVNTSSWGGSVLWDEASGLYYMWASEMKAHCGIDAWTTNSHIVEATSPDGLTFTRTGEVMPSFSHEPTVARAPNGDFVMYFTSSPPGTPTPPECRMCSDGDTWANATCAGGPKGAGPTYMSVAPRAGGPWGPRQQLFRASNETGGLDTNLAVVILRNGSVVGIGRHNGVSLVTASDWRDPDSYRGEWTTPLFPNTHRVPPWGVEDPFVYLDRRGALHAVFHSQIEADDQRLCGGHAFSEDGREWTFTGTAWSNAVELRGDEPWTATRSYRFSRRERPHLVFARDGLTIAALATGVQYGEGSPVYAAGRDACFTLLQPVGGDTEILRRPPAERS